MRKILLSLLLASTVATPALAQRPDREDRAAARQERSESRSQARADRSEARQDRIQVREDRSEARQDRVQVRDDRSDAQRDRADVRQSRMEAIQQRIEARQDQAQSNDAQLRQVVRQRVVRDNRPTMPAANVNERGRPVLDQQQQDVSGSVANWRRDQRDAAQQRVEQRLERNRIRVPVGARPDRPAPPPETATNRTRHPDWRTDWRRDHRYDWRDHRRHHRSTFHLGIYLDPFGWGYHRYGIGWRLWPSYYSSNYWLNDPYQYRLPYAPWPYKWVRYYDDALLVNTYTGQVVDVIYDFFW